MIRETLTAIGMAGRQALQCLGSRVEVRTQISQVREWSFAMPNLARVTVANSPVHQIYVGISKPLAQKLEGSSRLEVLLEGFKKTLTERVPAKRPIASWEMLPTDGRVRALRGVRSFILRQQTAAGNLYLMAELASRGEYETMRQSGWEEALVQQLLPCELAKLDTVESPVAINKIGTYLSRFEHDLELLVPGDDGLVHCGNGVLLNTSKDRDRMMLWLSLDLNKEERAVLKSGTELEGSFGAAGRVFRFRTFCRGDAALALEGVADLPCSLFEMPERFHLDQRRRYFRVRPGGALMAHLSVVAASVEGDLLSRPPQAPDARSERFAARVLDLSFSGLGLVLTDALPEVARTGCSVRLNLAGEGLPQHVDLSGVLRRLDRIPCGRGRYETQLGVEFTVDQPADQQGLQIVRQYVMAQQRELLARRTVVP